MNNNAARKVCATPAPFPAAEVFLARCEARAILVRWSYLELADAVDVLQAAAIAYGLVDELGQDAVQAMMAEAFADVDEVEIEIMPTGHKIQKPPEHEISPTGGNHAASSTVDALMLSLRERGEAAFAEPRCRQRLADLSTAQVCEVINRLMCLRSRYPAITDEVLFQLGEQLR